MAKKILLILTLFLLFPQEAFSYSKCDFLKREATGILLIAHPMSSYSDSECYSDDYNHTLSIYYQGLTNNHKMVLRFPNSQYFIGLPVVESDTSMIPPFLATSELLKYISKDNIDNLRTSSNYTVKSIVSLYDNGKLLRSDYILYLLLYLDYTSN
jgi:hypothetical protein